MWLILNKCGPEKLVNLMIFFHENEQAGISVGDNSAHVTVSSGMCSRPSYYILTW